MTKGFTKLFSSILTSTLWQEDDVTRIVWISMLALSDSSGFVSGSLPGLAHIARVSQEACSKAIAILSAPDPHSRTKDHGGCRIVESDGGWVILNYGKYRRMMSAEDRREYKRVKEQERRDRQRGLNVDTSGQIGTFVDTPASASVQGDKREERIRGESEGRKGAKRVKGDSATALEIYNAYPRKEARPDAIRAIEKAITNGATPEFLLERTKAYAATQPTRSRFTPLPATWFNSERFNDEPVEWKRNDDNGRSKRQSEADRDRDRTGGISNAGSGLKHL